MSIALLSKPNRSAFLGEPNVEAEQALGDLVTVVLFQFDASLTENFNRSAEVTTHPVEQGSDTTDNVRVLPQNITINGWVSDNPIQFAASLRTGPAPRTLAADAYETLNRIMDDKIPVRVVTSLKSFDDMILTNIDVTRDKDSGQILDATITLQQIIIATTETVEPPKPVKKQRAKKKKEGKKVARETTAPQDSILDGLFRRAG
jgi:hypothetical protein